MRHWLMGLALALGLGAAGCASGLDRATVGALGDVHEQVFPEYRGYYEADPNLTQEDKDRRARLLDEAKRLLEKMKEGLDE